MAKCDMLLSKFGNYLGQIIEFSKILIHLKALKTTLNISEYKHLWGDWTPKTGLSNTSGLPCRILIVEFSRILSNVRREIVAIGVQKVGRLLKQPLNSAKRIANWEGPKNLCLYRNIACNLTNHKRFCHCRNIISNSTKQLRPNHQSSSDVALFSTV